jgi:molecular chaperone DnaJ
MHTPSDPYAELGVPRDATQAQITEAFRRLLRRYHPDVRASADATTSADSDSALQRVIAAYSSLRDSSATRDRRPEETAPPAAPHAHRADAPIRAGPIRWTRDTRP